MGDPRDPQTPAVADPHPEEIRRGEVSVAELVEDYPDPTGEVPLYPLGGGDGSEDVDGW